MCEASQTGLYGEILVDEVDTRWSLKRLDVRLWGSVATTHVT